MHGGGERHVSNIPTSFEEGCGKRTRSELTFQVAAFTCSGPAPAGCEFVHGAPSFRSGRTA